LKGEWKMIHFDQEKCSGCGLCVKVCLPQVIGIENKKAVFKADQCFQCGHCIAICPENAILMDDQDMSEVLPYQEDQFMIEPERLLNFIKFRRSIRCFLSRPVEKKKLLEIIEAGRFTPTGSNLQGVSYVVVQENISYVRELAYKRLQEMAEQVLQDDTQPEVLKPFARRWMKLSQKYYQEGQDHLFFNAPALVLNIARSPVDAALAASNMELMTFALGLGCFYCGYFTRAAANNSEIKEVLGLDQTQEVVTCLVIGYPDVHYLRTVPRKKAKISWK
jgi:nitroreductase/NAD-dependent dihydropyrimidine dehydrogenase PreA subunit